MQPSLFGFLFLFPFLVSAQVPYDTLRPLRSVSLLFAFGRSELSQDYRDSLATWIPEAPTGGLRIDLLAGTDSIGTESANRELAGRRSRAVADALIALGWPADRIRKVAVGESDPVATNTTANGRQQNRRVAVTLMKPRPLTEISGRITDDSTGLPLQARVDIRARDWSDSTFSDTSGRFAYTLPVGEVVKVDIRRPGHFFTSEMVKALPGMKPLEIRIKPVTPGARADVRDLYFYGGSDRFLESSLPALDILVEFMRLNPTINIEIAGHVNVPWKPPVDTVSSDFRLSVDRARRVREYLVEQDILPVRMTSRGYGNWEMRFPYATEERQQALNRRVEIRILSTGVPVSRKEAFYEAGPGAEAD